jgi:hypothetical protein
MARGVDHLRENLERHRLAAPIPKKSRERPRPHVSEGGRGNGGHGSTGCAENSNRTATSPRRQKTNAAGRCTTSRPPQNQTGQVAALRAKYGSDGPSPFRSLNPSIYGHTRPSSEPSE